MGIARIITTDTSLTAGGPPNETLEKNVLDQVSVVIVRTITTDTYDGRTTATRKPAEKLA